MGSHRLKILVFHGQENASKHELLAWLRGPDVQADARTVGEMAPHSKDTVDERIEQAIMWADKAIAIVTPDDRSPSGSLNVIDEIGRWRGKGRGADLAILRDMECKDIWSNLGGVVRVEYKSRVNEAFIKLLRFLGLLSSGTHTSAPALAPVAIYEVLQNWKAPPEAGAIPVFIVVGGSSKYDSSRKSLGLKEYQSTEPVVGVVRVARSLSDAMGPRFVDAACDYSPVIRSANRPIDMVLVGAGDTNRVTKEIFLQDVSLLPVRFEPPTGSDAIVVSIDGEAWSTTNDGLILALKHPLRNVRYAVVCAGNGARGTNAALTSLARWLRQPTGTDPIKKMQAAVVVQALDSGEPIKLWPPSSGVDA